MISFDLHAQDEVFVLGALRQLLGEKRRRQLIGLRRLARRKQRDDAARAVDKLQVGDEIAQLLERGAREQRLSFDHDQDVEFAGRKAPGLLLVLPELARVGAKQLAQRVVDLDALGAEKRGDDQPDKNETGKKRRAQREQADALQPERDALGGRLLDHLDMDFIVADFFEHALSSSHMGSSLWAQVLSLKFWGCAAKT